jgi:hypothetical protein
MTFGSATHSLTKPISASCHFIDGRDESGRTAYFLSWRSRGPNKWKNSRLGTADSGACNSRSPVGPRNSESAKLGTKDGPFWGQWSIGMKIKLYAGSGTRGMNIPTSKSQKFIPCVLFLNSLAQFWLNCQSCSCARNLCVNVMCQIEKKPVCQKFDLT